MKTVVRVDRELEDPFPPDAKELDLVVINLVYHDTVSLGIDRDKMNRAVYSALKKGGRYVVIDHSALHGSGLDQAKSMHRIDEATVRAEVARAGFVLQTAESFLRNPADTRDWNASPQGAGAHRGTSDRFALAFVKP
jgi:predicted methyltransferase